VGDRSFATLLRAYRARARLTQERLAEQTGLSERTIRQLEQGRVGHPQAQTVGYLAQALALSPAERAALEAAAWPLALHRPSDRAAAATGGLPAPLTPLIGREQEVAALMGLLRDDGARFVTLTGPGGVGKTRLAVHVAAVLSGATGTEVLFVSLAALRDPRLVLPTIAQAAGVHEARPRTLPALLGAALHDRRLLLVLDNFEQVLPAAGDVAALAASCPALTVLATSRASLRVQAEQLFGVRPLDLPDLACLPPPEELARSGAVALLVQRARTVVPGFQLNVDNVPAVVAICARLDGLPLAIELVVPRFRVLPPSALLARLEHRLPLLTGGAADLPARQQSLQATLAWSHDLLDGAAQALFRRLAVFVGGATLDAVETVCLDEARRGGALLDALGALVDMHLLYRDGDGAGVQADTPGGPRFAMLETIHEFAVEQLAQSGEGEPVARRHATYYLALAEEAAPMLRGPHQGAWLARLEREHDNLRAALAWAQQHGETAIGLRLAGTLAPFWWRHGHLSEGRRWLDALLSLRERDASHVDVRVQARALDGAGKLASEQGDGSAAATHYAESLALYRSVDDRRGMARTLGSLALFKGPAGAALLEESLGLWRVLGDPAGIAFALTQLGDVARMQGAYARATALLEESLSLREEVGDTAGVANSLFLLGRTMWEHGEGSRAHGLMERSLSLRRALDHRAGIAFSLGQLGSVAGSRGDVVRATALLEESLALMRALGLSDGVVAMLSHLGGVARDQGDDERALALLEESVRLARTLSSGPALAWALDESGELARSQGDYRRARALHDECLALRRIDGEATEVASSLCHLGAVFQAQGEHDRARPCYAEGLAVLRSAPHKQVLAECLECVAGLAAAQGHAAAAAGIWGAAAGLRAAAGTPLPPLARPAYERALNDVRRALGAAPFDEAWAAGQRLSLEQAITAGLRVLA
jgi:predicted ATPase/transcriptional regulator with XRE-family HTH domain